MISATDPELMGYRARLEKMNRHDLAMNARCDWQMSWPVIATLSDSELIDVQVGYMWKLLSDKGN